MKKAIFAFLFPAVLLLSAGTPAYAWGNTWMGMAIEQAINAAHFRSGPLRYDMAFFLNAGHTSDVYFGSETSATPDYTFTTAPSLHFMLPVQKRVVFDIYELPQYVFFLDTKHYRSLNNTFAGLVHIVLDRFYFQAGGGLINVKDRLSTEVNLDVRHEENRLNGVALWQVSKGASVALQFRRIVFNYAEATAALGLTDIAAELDRTEDFVNASIFLEQHARVRFYLDGECGSYRFAEIISRFKDSRSYCLSGGVDFLPPAAGYEGQTSGVRGGINLGYKHLDFLDPLQKGFSGLAGNVSVSLGIMRLTAIHAAFSRGPQFSVYSGVGYYLQTSYGAGVSRSLTRRILLTYDFAHNQNDYPAGLTSGGSSLRSGVDRYMTHSFRLGFVLSRDLEIDFMANLDRRNSKVAFRPVSNYNYFGISIIYGHGSGVQSMPAGSRA